MWRVCWGQKGQTQGCIVTARLMYSLWVLNYMSVVGWNIWCTISLPTKTRRQNTEIPWRPALDFPVEPGAKINQPWGKNRPALTYGKVCQLGICLFQALYFETERAAATLLETNYITDYYFVLCQTCSQPLIITYSWAYYSVSIASIHDNKNTLGFDGLNYFRLICVWMNGCWLWGIYYVPLHFSQNTKVCWP